MFCLEDFAKVPFPSYSVIQVTFSLLSSLWGGVVTAKAVCCGSNKVIAVINNSGEGICQNNNKKKGV